MGSTIAVVDDNELLRTWLREVLEGAKYGVVTYGSSFGIHSFIKKNRPAALILDVNMPALSGVVVCNLLKEDPENKTLRIILYSALALSVLKESAQRCKADAYLAKSNDPKPLLELVRSLLSHPPPS